MTVNELAELVLEQRKDAWAKSDPQPAIVATQQLPPEDEEVVRRVVAEAGYTGAEAEEMVRRVCTRIVGRVEALSDDLPADGGD